MIVAIVDYGSGNLRSAGKALERAAEDAGVSADVRVTAEASAVAAADRIVLPGVGAFADCRAGLKALDGMEAALEEAVLSRGRPFLGICVGMQLLAEEGLEHGRHEGLGWLPGRVLPIDSQGSLKVPHMGWNDVMPHKSDHPLLAGLEAGSHFYFVHSYHFHPDDQDHCLAEVDYGAKLTAMAGRDNIAGTQFHPEKSQTAGLRLLANFLRWSP